MTRKVNTQGTLNAYVVTPMEFRKWDRYGYKVIAVIFSETTWCAFRGLTDVDDDEIAKHGEEVPAEVAKYLFSTLFYNIPNYENL